MKQFIDNASTSFENTVPPHPLQPSGKMHPETNEYGYKESGEVKENQGVVKDQKEEQKIWQILYEVKDPEIPVLSIIDLGIVRSIHYSFPTKAEPILSDQESASIEELASDQGSDTPRHEKSPHLKDGIVEVVITPTYSGCPAMDVIRMDIRLKLLEHGYKNIIVNQSLSPAWTSDWMTEVGKQKLREFGIAPPNPKQQFCTSEMFKEEAVQCPYCNSYNTIQVSRFGSTACKAIYQCSNCKETFDYFKCH